MSPASDYQIHLIFLLVVPRLSTSVFHIDFDRYTCPHTSNTWSLLVDQFYGFSVQCFHVYSALDFQEGLRHCHLQQAAVISLSRPDSYVLPTGTRLADYLVANDVSSVWDGAYIQNDKIRMDGFPGPTFFGSWVKHYSNISWDKYDPEATMQCLQLDMQNIGNCSNTSRTALQIQTTMFLPSPPNSTITPQAIIPILGEDSGVLGGRFLDRKRRRRSMGLVKRLFAKDPWKKTIIRTKRQVGDNVARCHLVTDVEVKFQTCSHRLPVVCVKPAVMKSTERLMPVPEICRSDEIGNYKLPHCISYNNEKVNYSLATKKCKKRGGPIDGPRLTPSYPGIVTYFQSKIAINYYKSPSSFADLQNDRLAWISDGHKYNNCLAVSSRTTFLDAISWDCSVDLPYICDRAPVLPNLSSITLSAIGFDTENITGSDDKQIAPPLIATSNITVDLLCSLTPEPVREIQRLTLMKGGFPFKYFYKYESEEAISLPSALLSSVSGQYGFLNSTDYYWCEVNDLRTGDVQTSARVFFRYREIEIYTASITLNTSTSERSDLLHFSLTRNSETLHNTVQFLERQMFKPSSYIHRWLRFRPKPAESNCLCTKTIADFYIFRNILTARKFKPTNRSIAIASTVLRNEFLQLNQSFFLTQSMELRSIDICPNTSVHDPILQRSFAVPDTELGVVYRSREICLANGLPYVTMKCVGDKLFGARWQKFEPNEGCNFSLASESPITYLLKSISQADINRANVTDLISTTNMIITGQTLHPVDVVYIADILQKSTQLDDLANTTSKQILEIVDLMVNLNDSILTLSQNLGNATSRIINAVDSLGDKVDLTGNPYYRFITPSLAMEVWNLTGLSGDLIIGLELRLGGEELVSAVTDKDLVSLFESRHFNHVNTDAAIFLQANFLRQLQNENIGRTVKLSTSVFANSALFRNNRLEIKNDNSTKVNSSLNSKVISAKLTINGNSVTDLRAYNVTTVYFPTTKLQETERKEKTMCVFWDFAGGGGAGAWSADGCRYQGTLQDKDVCVCDHLTNFAVLVDLYGQTPLSEGHQATLTIITVIGLSLSITGLSITILSFLLIKKLRQGRHQQTLFNMALAMLSAWIVFLAGFTRVDSHGGCIAVAVLLHYFILASFLWMLMEGIMQYLLFVKVLGTSFDKYLLKTAVPAWGTPLVPVIVILSIDTKLYRGGDQYCWMSLTPFYYAFLAPIAAVVLTNVIIYVMVVTAISRRRVVTAHSKRSDDNRTAMNIKASVACFVVLGLSWIFAFFAVADVRVVFQYLFTITTPLQGFLIFAIFTARDPAVRAFWKRKCCPTKKATIRKTTPQSPETSPVRSSEFQLPSFGPSDD